MSRILEGEEAAARAALPEITEAEYNSKLLPEHVRKLAEACNLSVHGWTDDDDDSAVVTNRSGREINPAREGTERIHR